jgi:hypothetical protein
MSPVSAIKLRTNWLLGEWHVIDPSSSHSARNKPPPDLAGRGFCLIECIIHIALTQRGVAKPSDLVTEQPADQAVEVV